MAGGLTISRVRLCIRPGRGVDRRATAAYLIHQAVADLFGDREDRGYLFRVLRERGPEVVVLTLSAVPPLPLLALRSPDHRRATKIESKPFEPSIEPGQRLDYELLVNAVKQYVDEETGKTIRRDVWDAVWMAEPETPLSPHDIYHEWLSGKLDGCARVLDARVTERGEVRARRPGCSQAIAFIAANLVGTLEVVDPERLLGAIAAGFGRSRAFGCGLLCLSRPGTILLRHWAGPGLGTSVELDAPPLAPGWRG